MQHQIVNRLVAVAVFGADIKEIAAGDAVRPVIQHMQPVAAPHQHQFAELVGMLGKDVLRVAIRHDDRLGGCREEIRFPEH